MASYTDKDIKVLSEIEHIRANRAMYIGSTEVPNHLLYELLDNALDEAHAGYATLVGVLIDTNKHTISVSDNGRGIPFQNNTIPTLVTKLFSGGKFDKANEKSAYKIASGLHGIGLVAITALSDWMDITVYRDDKKAFYRYEHALLKEEKLNDFTNERPFSTQITFKPTKKYFDKIDVDIDSIRNRMNLASVHIPNLKLVLMVDDKKQIIDHNIDSFFKETLIIEDTKTTPVWEIRNKIKDEELWIKFCWDLEGSTAKRHSGCVNLLEVNQGYHMLRTEDVFKDILEDISKKEKLVFQKNDAMVGFRCHTSLFLYTPEYSSQTKERLATNKDKLSHLYINAEQQLRSLFDNNKEIRDQILLFLNNYRKKQTASKNIIKSGNTVSRYGCLIDSKLRDCTSHDVEKTELFLVEGSSAGGSLIMCRDPKYHAVLGLKGKIPNIAIEGKEALKNKEIVEIINALGTGVAPAFNASGMRYFRTILSVDADPDGGHICSLLMIVFLKLVPELIKEKRIYRAIMPLYGTMHGGKFIPFYSEQELEEFKKKNENAKIQRYKGLGEMNPDQLKVCLIDHDTRRLQLIEYPTDGEKDIYDLMTDPEVKRQLIK